MQSTINRTPGRSVTTSQRREGPVQGRGGDRAGGGRAHGEQVFPKQQKERGPVPDLFVPPKFKNVRLLECTVHLVGQATARPVGSGKCRTKTRCQVRANARLIVSNRSVRLSAGGPSVSYLCSFGQRSVTSSQTSAACRRIDGCSGGGWSPIVWTSTDSVSRSQEEKWALVLQHPCSSRLGSIRPLVIFGLFGAGGPYPRWRSRCRCAAAEYCTSLSPRTRAERRRTRKR